MDRSGAMPEVNNSRRTRTTVLVLQVLGLLAWAAPGAAAQEPVQAARGSERTEDALAETPPSTAAPLAQSRAARGETAGKPVDDALGKTPPSAAAQPAQSRATQSETASKRVDDALGETPPRTVAQPAQYGTAQNETASERIEEALGERASPLDAVAVDVQNAEYDKAEAFLTAYIRALEAARHRYHADLVRPHILLGDAQFGQQDYAAALDSYATAVHVSRVSDGLFTPDQVEAVYKQSETLQRLGDAKTAANREQYAFAVLTKAHGANSLALLPGVFRLAQWQLDAHNIFSARALYEQALRIHHANGQAGAPEAVPALQGLVKTYRLERFPPYETPSRDDRPDFPSVASRSGFGATSFDAPLTINNFPVAERALQDVIRIRQQDPNTGPMPVSEAILDLADWHLLWEHFRKAKTLYEHVYERLQLMDSVDAAAYFGEPRLLHLPVPKSPRPPPVAQRGEETNGFVTLEFGVSANGSVQNLKVVASEPPGMMDFAVRRSLRTARYRPALVDGKTAAYEGQTHHHDFSYFPRVQADGQPDAKAKARGGDET